MLAEGGVLFLDPRDRIADAVAHGLADPLGRIRSLAGAPAETVSGRQLLADEIDLLAESTCALGVTPLRRLLELGAKVFESLLVLGPRLRIEELAGVAETRGAPEV